MTYADLVQSQRLYFNTHATKSLSFRLEQLNKLKGLIIQSEHLFYEAIAKDFGKSSFDTLTTELGFILNELQFYIKNLSSLARPKTVRTSLTNFPGKSKLYKEPLGTCLVIGAWNYPIQLALLPAISAIAAGNTVILKPSELAPATANLLAELINQRFSSNYFVVVQGDVVETTSLLKEKFDHIFFTGSPAVGKIIYQAAAKHLTPVTLELGGKSPVIVSPSANLKVAAKRIVWGKFLNAGQTCIAPDFVLAHEAIYEEFYALLQEQLQIFNYKEGSHHYTRIINERHFDRLYSLLDEKSTYVASSLKPNKATLFFPPTLIKHASWSDACMQEEIFGPLLPLLKYQDFESTMDKLIALEKPLSAYLFSNDSLEQRIFTANFSFGGGCINDTLMHVNNPSMPFGGVGNSGMGNYHGKYGFDTFSHVKPVFKKPNLFEINLKYPPYSITKFKWVKRIFGLK